MNVFKNIYNYRELLKNNVKKEIRGKYKNSALGVIWTFLNPLLQLLVYAKFFAEKFKLKPAGVFYLPLSNAFSKEESKKPYVLSGTMLQEDSIIKSLDSKLVDANAVSDIVPLKTTKDGEMYNTNFYKYMCLSKEDYDYLLNFAISQVDIAITNILSGEISARPLIDSNYSSCTYCDYKGICNYLDNNDKEIVKAQTIEELKKSGEKDGGI